MGSSLLKINKIAVYHINQGGGGGCHSQPVELVCSQGEGISDLSSVQGEGAEGGDGSGDHDAQADLVYLSNRTYDR